MEQTREDIIRNYFEENDDDFSEIAEQYLAEQGYDGMWHLEEDDALNNLDFYA